VIKPNTCSSGEQQAAWNGLNTFNIQLNKKRNIM